MRVNQQKAFALVNRPYSETSWIVEMFSKDYGRFSVMAKGARRIKSKLKGVLMPFQPLLISWVGKGEIPTLTSAEIDLNNFNLIQHELLGDGLVCGFYCNELIVNLLHRHDAHPKLFDAYSETLKALSSSNDNEVLASALREFEQTVTKEAGYGVDFTMQSDGKTKIELDQSYVFQHGHGFVPCTAQQSKALSGRIIRSLSNDESIGLETLSSWEMSQSKHLMRDILNQTLGYRKVISRELFFPKER